MAKDFRIGNFVFKETHRSSNDKDSLLKSHKKIQNDSPISGVRLTRNQKLKFQLDENLAPTKPEKRITSDR